MSARGRPPSRREAAPDALADYARKRDFGRTAEPPAAARRARSRAGALRFVVQKHAARRLHYDFRLEIDGTLKSWAVPKGPSLDPAVKRLAVRVEDHPLEYAAFEGTIPAGEYGGGEVIVWDRGTWSPQDADPAAAWRAGKLKFRLAGEKLSGGWTLVRTRGGTAAQEQWLLMKDADEAARRQSDLDVVAARPDSVLAPPPRRAVPEWIGPELATPLVSPPAGSWRYELKFDGYRLLARVDAGRARLFTRNRRDWTSRLAPLQASIEALGLDSAWLDGEIVVVDAHGVPDFQALQNALEEGRNGDIRYYLFDLPWHAGEDLRAQPLESRRARLKALLAAAGSERLRYSEDFAAPGEAMLASACELRLEGVIGKRAGSPYRSLRSADWIKLKCRLRQEFVIVGYSAPQGGRKGFGALLLGVHEGRGGKGEEGEEGEEGGANGRLRYAGRVGSGFSDASLQALHQRMSELARPGPALDGVPGGSRARGVTWLEPRLLCEVEFATWTREGLVRQAVFHGLRDDRPAQRIVRERALPAGSAGGQAMNTAKARTAHDTVAGIAISHASRVIDAASGVTKGELAAFYCRIAPWLLPHLAGRPVSIVRAPAGIGGEQFFQRHAEKLAIPGVRLLPPGPEDDAPLMEVRDLKGLVGATQMGTVEYHTWNATSSQLERPDRMVFDLDPDPALPWSRMVEATRLVLALLDELGLRAFLKTSGGKGMHLVVPLARRHDWDTVKTFSHAVSTHLARVLPRLFVDRMGPKNRVGRIFVDYLRNQRGASTVAAFSVRARPGLPVSVPIARDELDALGSAAEWTVQTLPQRLEGLRGDPWRGYAHRQTLSDAMRRRLAPPPSR